MKSTEQKKTVWLAVDLGASSGRLIAASLNEGLLKIEEIRRFKNPAIDLPTGFYWNMFGLFEEICTGLQGAVDRFGDQISSIGIDTWGCDFALLDDSGEILLAPHQYRDPRFEGMMEVMHAAMPESTIYEQSGIKTNFYNSSVHLTAIQKSGSPALGAATQLLFIPDLLAYWLSGEKAIERTIASTSQLLNPATGNWAKEVISALNLPENIFGEIATPATILGTVRPEFTKGHTIKLVTAPSHDTASAVAGIPLTQEQPLWLSSGTWSIMGVETNQPIQSTKALEYGFCNELGINDSVRFLKNISGLWILQECKRFWDKSEPSPISFSQLTTLADEAKSFAAFIDPDDPIFAEPGDMPKKIQDYCRNTSQDIPETIGQIARVATDSLALKYRFTYERIIELTGRTYQTLHAGGGGIQNQALCQATANALGIHVIAGPIEATACGNILSQLVATDAIADFTEGRELVRKSFEFASYSPSDRDTWNDAYAHFIKTTGLAQ